MRRRGARRGGAAPPGERWPAYAMQRVDDEPPELYAGDRVEPYRVQAAVIDGQTAALQAEARRLLALAEVVELRQQAEHTDHDHAEAMRAAARDGELTELEHRDERRRRIRALRAVPAPPAVPGAVPGDPSVRTGDGDDGVPRSDLLPKVIDWALAENGAVPSVHRIRKEYPPLGTRTAQALQHAAARHLAGDVAVSAR